MQYMDVREIRLANLRRLLNDRFNNVVAEFARAIDKDPNQARFILNPTKPGGRWLGERLARTIEKRLNLTPGSLDQNHGGETVIGEMTREEAALLDNYRNMKPEDQKTFAALGVSLAAAKYDLKMKKGNSGD